MKIYNIRDILPLICIQQYSVFETVILWLVLDRFYCDVFQLEIYY